MIHSEPYDAARFRGLAEELVREAYHPDFSLAHINAAAAALHAAAEQAERLARVEAALRQIKDGAGSNTVSRDEPAAPHTYGGIYEVACAALGEPSDGNAHRAKEGA